MKLRGRFKMDAERAVRLREYLDQQTDWVGKCRKCGKLVAGTPAFIRSHKCADDDKVAEVQA